MWNSPMIVHSDLIYCQKDEGLLPGRVLGWRIPFGEQIKIIPVVKCSDNR